MRRTLAGAARTGEITMALEVIGRDGSHSISRTQLIRRPGLELYRVLQGVHHWPKFMPFLAAVLEQGKRSRWCLKDGSEWVMEQTHDILGRSLAWRGIGGESAPSVVTVHVHGVPIPGSAEVRVAWRFEAGPARPPGVFRSAALALDEALEVFRILMEVRRTAATAVPLRII
ncbi:MAG: SRPBCC family protein [Gemmatimonadetes bacterium]|nr:SRPBCC family protein [Gemmatimonadota bacterium]